MYFLSTVLIKELYCFSHLSSSYYAVVNEQQFFTLNKLVDRNQLHFSYLISHCLVGRHKASGPCGSVLDKRTCERDTAPVCVAYCVRYARIRNTAYIVNIGQLAVLYIVLRHNLAVACTHRFNGHTLIYRIRIAVICPHERAYMHFAFIAVTQHFTAVRSYHIYFAGTKLFICAVAELLFPTIIGSLPY